MPRACWAPLVHQYVIGVNAGSSLAEARSAIQVRRSSCPSGQSYWSASRPVLPSALANAGDRKCFGRGQAAGERQYAGLPNAAALETIDARVSKP